MVLIVNDLVKFGVIVKPSIILYFFYSQGILNFESLVYLGGVFSLSKRFGKHQNFPYIYAGFQTVFSLKNDENRRKFHVF